MPFNLLLVVPISFVEIMVLPVEDFVNGFYQIFLKNYIKNRCLKANKTMTVFVHNAII